MFEFKLPDLGEGIHEGEILKWHVQPGDAVREDDPLVEVETDKAAVTIPSPKGGRVVSVVGKPGDVVHVGDVIAVIEVEGAVNLSALGASVVSRTSALSPPSGHSPPAAPATRKLARDLGVDLRLVTPTGPGGRVTPEDVKSFAAGARTDAARPAPSSTSSRAPSAPSTASSASSASSIPLLDLEPLPDFEAFGPVEREPLRSIRRKTARKMVTSAILVPHVAHMDEADVTELEELRKRERERREGRPGGKLTLLAFVARAVIAGLRRYPMFNASVDPFREEIVTKRYYNLGVAVDSGKGLVVPVVRGADRLSILEVSAAIEQAAGKAREGKLDVSDLRGGTFTITNIGAIGGTGMVPIINYPEVAILGLARVQEKPVVRDGQIVVRRILALTLAFDHRIADGADAARFVNEVVRLLADPAALLLEG